MSDEQGAIPEGWQLVPIKPTEAMIEAAINYRPVSVDDRLKIAWADMIGAAPAYTPAADRLTDTGEGRTWEPCACGHDNEDDVCAYHEAIVLRRHPLATPKPPVDAGAMRWQGMDSAPKDQPILAVMMNRVSQSKPSIAVIWWDDEFEQTGWDEDRDESEYRGGWTAGKVFDFGMEEIAEEHPEFWMPLPAIRNLSDDGETM